MNTRTPKTPDSQGKNMAGVLQQKKAVEDGMSPALGISSEGDSQRNMVDSSPQAKQLKAYHNISNGVGPAEKPVQKKANDTGLPDNLKSGMESLSGYSLDDVKVHYNSPQPAQLQAHAYAQGSNIHLGPGQEKHLPHEAWHVVQQKQGRVKPTLQMKGKVNINDDTGLEKEADIMGGKALQMKAWIETAGISKKLPTGDAAPVQRNGSGDASGSAPPPVSSASPAPVSASPESAPSESAPKSPEAPKEVADKAEEAEQLNPGDLADNYLRALRTTKMWGGYAEANAIAKKKGFKAIIFGEDRVTGRLKKLADIGNAGSPARDVNLFWSGNHYQVVEESEGDEVPDAPFHDPTGDGNCLFEALFVIMRNGAGNEPRMLSESSARRATEVKKMRETAAEGLAEDPVLLGYLGGEYQNAKDEKKRTKDQTEWTNIGADIETLKLFRAMLDVVYKQYTPKVYYLIVEAKNNYFSSREDLKAGKKKAAKHSLTTFLRDNPEIAALLNAADAGKKKKEAVANRQKFSDWMRVEARGAYQKDIAAKAGEVLPDGYDEYSYKSVNSKAILSFFEALVPTSPNLENISQHMDISGKRSSQTYEDRPVYHYSRGKDSWGKQYTAFYTLLDDRGNYIKIVGLGSHIEGGSASYKLDWGIGGSTWKSGGEVHL